MRAANVSLLCCLLISPTVLTLGQGPLVKQGQETPAVDGYITRATSESDFDVNGLRILCGQKTMTLVATKPGESDGAKGCPQYTPYVGEVVRVYGSVNRKKQAVQATRIEFALAEERAAISGWAVIEVLEDTTAPGSQPGKFLVRADGYWIQVDNKTELSFTPPRSSLTDVKAGDWIEYKGTQGPDGVVAAKVVRLSPNIVSKGEEKLRAKNDFDPSAVPGDAKQNYLKDAVVGGLDPKKFPPYQDRAMQARINEIGGKLIPAYQRALPDSDPSKIRFRFQLIDTKWFRDALTTPDGVILVPHQVVERMQSDAQLATVLADNIACALEKQDYHTQPERRAADVAAAAGVFVPLAGSGIVVGSTIGAMEILTEERRQSGRVSLGLLHDAGYDIDQAPMAWWLLGTRESKPVAGTTIPPRAAYLYHILGETWHNPRVDAARAH